MLQKKNTVNALEAFKGKISNLLSALSVNFIVCIEIKKSKVMLTIILYSVIISTITACVNWLSPISIDVACKGSKFRRGVCMVALIEESKGSNTVAEFHSYQTLVQSDYCYKKTNKKISSSAVYI